MENEEKDIIEPTIDDTVEEEAPETIEEEEETQEEDSEYEDIRARLEQLEKENKTLKIQKAKLKEKKESKSEPVRTEGRKEVNTSGDQLTKEEAILFARGLSEEEVEKVKSIAKIEGESPLVSAESDYFKIWKDKEDKKKETQDTQLGASTGSIKRQPKKDFGSQNLSSNEHKELWRKQMGR